LLLFLSIAFTSWSLKWKKLNPPQLICVADDQIAIENMRTSQMNKNVSLNMLPNSSFSVIKEDA